MKTRQEADRAIATLEVAMANADFTSDPVNTSGVMSGAIAAIEWMFETDTEEARVIDKLIDEWEKFIADFGIKRT